MPPTDAPDPADRRGTGRRRAGPRSGPGTRLGPRAYRALRTAHIVVSGGWLGVGIGKLVLEIGALTTGSTQRAEALYTAATTIGWVFPPMIVATLLTGVLLAVGTRWGLLRYYWVLTKLGLTLTVVVTAMALVDGLTSRAVPGVAVSPMKLVTSMSAVYAALLLVAMVVSVYKPWGRIAWRRRFL